MENLLTTGDIADAFFFFILHYTDSEHTNGFFTIIKHT